PLDVVREERQARQAQAASARLSRRQFLGGAGAGAAVLALPGRASAAHHQPVVAVIGGGIAGLTCALALRDHGISSTVYEASGRIGGRMFTNSRTWAAGQTSEWGG
ncbi:MAG TPA: FAD-dependent oxidoreductase, partial [Kofleriaceae bacterium]|nr:FAD-dependent oxidoreductase [Kofleriaceae bacterium]